LVVPEFRYQLGSVLCIVEAAAMVFWSGDILFIEHVPTNVGHVSRSEADLVVRTISRWVHRMLAWRSGVVGVARWTAAMTATMAIEATRTTLATYNNISWGIRARIAISRLVIMAKLMTKHFGIKLNRRYGLKMSHNCQHHWVEVFIETSKDVWNELFITERMTGYGHVISEATHLGVIINNCLSIVSGGGERHARLHRMCTHVGCIHASKGTPHFNIWGHRDNPDEDLPSETRYEVSENRLISSNPVHVRRVWLIDDAVTDGVLNYLWWFLLWAIKKTFKLHGSNGRHDLGMPKKVIGVGDLFGYR
jgi:hypothetical protein